LTLSRSACSSLTPASVARAAPERSAAHGPKPFSVGDLSPEELAIWEQQERANVLSEPDPADPCGPTLQSARDFGSTPQYELSPAGQAAGG
jgi:hypothetical protein